MLTLLLALGLLLTAFLVYVARQPQDYTITRERLIAAPPEVLFPYLDNSRKANTWMPWEDTDPAVKMRYSGPDAGVGSKSSWESSGRMGVGEAVVVKSVPLQSVTTQLTYTRPMAMAQTAEISLIPSAGGTLVRWSVTGKNNFVGRVVCVFMNMDKMVGGMFEQGLEKLKRLVETAAPAA